MTDTFLRVRRVVLLICVVVAAMVGGVTRPPSAAAASTVLQGQVGGGGAAMAAKGTDALQGEAPELDDKNPVGVTAVAERAVTLPGDRFVIAVRFAFAEHFHIWPNKPTVPAGMEELVPIPTEIRVGGEGSPAVVPGVKVLVDRTQWPAPDDVSVGFTSVPTTIKSHKKPFTAFVPVLIAPDAAPGEVVIPLTVSYQSCNETTCFRPESVTLPVRVTIAPAALASSSAPTPTGSGSAAAKTIDTPGFAALATGLDRRALADLTASPANDPAAAPATSSATATNNTTLPPPASVINFGAFGIDINIDTASSLGLVLVTLVALVGGFLLNLMPCVLPVIPIKIIGLQQAAHNSRARMIILGLATGAGVVAIWLLGGVLVSLAVISALSQLVSYWWFNLAIALVILLMGLGMFGLFQAGLPQWVYNLNPKHESVGGSFAYGMLHAVFSIPCVAPLGGAAIAWAATQQPGVTLLVFTAVGVGMAVPYILLSVFPGLLKVIPKAGPASDLLKQVMGMMMIAAGLFFLGTALISLVKTHPYIAYTLHWWAAGIVLVITGLWLAGRIVIVARGPWTKVILGALGLALAAGGVLLAIGETRDRREAYDAEVLAAKSSAGQSKRGAYDPGHLWQPYSPEAYDAAIRDGRVVVLDFTAEWCFNCKALEKAVLRRDDVRAALTRPNVVTFKADLTARNAPGWDRLAALGRNGIPLIAISGPGLTTPFLSEAFTPAQVIDNTTAALGPAK